MIRFLWASHVCDCDNDSEPVHSEICLVKTYTHANMYTCKQAFYAWLCYMYMYMCMCMHIYIYVCVYIYTYIHIHRYTHVHTNMHRLQCSYTYMYTYIHVYMHTHIKYIHAVAAIHSDKRLGPVLPELAGIICNVIHACMHIYIQKREKRLGPVVP